MSIVSHPDEKHPPDPGQQELLSAWLDGELSDAGEVEALLSTSPEARMYLEQLQKARTLYHAGRQRVSCDPEAMIGAIINRVRQETEAVEGAPRPIPKRAGLPWGWVAAAAALLILAAGGVLLQQVRFTPGMPRAEETAGAGGWLPADEKISDTDLAAILDENFADSTVLPDLWENLPEEELLQYAALWEDETASPDGPEDSGLWWEQAEQLAAVFDSNASGDPEFPVPQP